MVKIYTETQNESDSGIESSSEKVHDLKNYETSINDSCEQLGPRDADEVSERQSELREKYDFAIKEGLNALATVQNANAVDLESQASDTISEDLSTETQCREGDAAVVLPGLMSQHGATKVHISDSDNFHVGTLVNQKVTVNVVDKKSNGGSSHESIEEARKKFGTVFKLVAGSVVTTLVLVIIIVIVEITQLQNSSSGDKPSYDEAWEGNVVLITRKQWNARVPDPPTESFAALPKMVVIIHTGGRICPSANVSCRDIVRLIQSGHMALGWRDIGYNFLVGGDGQVYAGTAWNRWGRHSLDENNNKSIGLAFIGDFNKNLPTNGQMIAARAIVEVGFSLSKLDPKAYVVFHSQIRPFNSPGRYVRNIIKREWPWWSPLGVKDPERALNFTEIFFERSHWFAADPKGPFKKNKTFPLKTVKISMTESNSQKNTLKTVMELQKRYQDGGLDDLPSNFVITEDGSVFEGRGWDYSHSEEDDQSIQIEMLVKTTQHGIKEKMGKSLNLLLAVGITREKLAPDHQIVYL